jgi:hypothetical protein
MKIASLDNCLSLQVCNTCLQLGDSLPFGVHGWIQNDKEFRVKFIDTNRLS